MFENTPVRIIFRNLFLDTQRRSLKAVAKFLVSINVFRQENNEAKRTDFLQKYFFIPFTIILSSSSCFQFPIKTIQMNSSQVRLDSTFKRVYSELLDVRKTLVSSPSPEFLIPSL